MSDLAYLAEVAEREGIEFIDEVAAALRIPREWEASRTRARLVAAEESR